jgi:hypothetical protein
MAFAMTSFAASAQVRNNLSYSAITRVFSNQQGQSAGGRDGVFVRRRPTKQSRAPSVVWCCWLWATVLSPDGPSPAIHGYRADVEPFFGWEDHGEDSTIGTGLSF